MILRYLFFAVCLIWNLEAIAQIKFGFELNAYSSTLKNISPDTIVPWGYSGAKVTQSPSYGLAPSFLLRKDIGKNFSLETGLGYWSNKYKLNLHAYNRWIRTTVDSTLNISLKYIQIPVLLSYSIPINKTTSFLFSGGIRSKVLIHQKDNYQDIKFEDIGFSADFRGYKRIVLSPSLAIALNRQINNGKSFELGLFGSMDATPFARSAWGFYNNLHPARSLQTGISLKYFL